ncbi:MAG TPA: guanylate kinase [Candidatus Tectomicrobia bacterium]|nr:guanylate kinase [Candidatus Tectomicrobia bacterium]
MSKLKTSNDTSETTVRGRIVVLSAPSGGGKTTLAQAAIAQTPGLVRSVTYTTRPKRPAEEDGRDYHFISQAVFEQKRRRGEFLECATVHGHLYGTSRLDVNTLCAQGLDVLLVLDYQGAASLRQQRLDALSIFILPPSLKALEQRLRQRNSETEATLQRRLAIAPTEMAQYRHYDYVIINDDRESAVQQLQAIILADRCRVERLNRRYPIFAELDG